MKIGILTADKVDNFGTDLQALAMLNLFRFCNSSVEIINYKSIALNSYSNIFKNLSVSKLVHLPFLLLQHYLHYRFRKKFFIMGDKCYDAQTLNNATYKCIVVGSDQIWNLDLTKNDIGYFLPYTNNIRKYSYAVSMGGMDINIANEQHDIGGLLNKFATVSVRESSTIDKLKEIGVNARFDLDPLLMLEKKVWKQYAKINKRKRNYALLYLVEEDAEAEKAAINYSNSHGLELISIDNSLKCSKEYRRIRLLSVSEWLALMDKASCVFANSYHGLSFAINFNRPFFVFKLKANPLSNKRMIDLLATFELKNRIVLNTEVSDNEINWSYVNKKIEQLKAYSLNYIKEIEKSVV